MFDYLDSNNNNVLDNADKYVRVASVTEQGQSRLSTIIEMGKAHGDLPLSSGAYGSGDVAIVFGVTGLTVDDFV